AKPGPPALRADTIDRLAPRRHVVAVAELVRVRDRVNYAVKTVDVCAHAHGLLFDSRINFRDDLDLRIHRLRVLGYLAQKVREGLNPELNPLSKRGIGKISNLQIVLCVETGLFFESR